MTRAPNPNNPPCRICGRTLSVETDFYWICHACNKTFKRGMKKVRPPGPDFKILWLCSRAAEDELYRAGNYYDAALVRADIRDNVLRPGTVFITRGGQRLEIR